jgi:hypothetical protein
LLAAFKGFFDSLPLAIILEAVAAQVADGNILRLIEKFLRGGVMEDGVFKPTTIGTPQGGVVSPLLANIVHFALCLTTFRVWPAARAANLPHPNNRRQFRSESERRRRTTADTSNPQRVAQDEWPSAQKSRKREAPARKEL